MMENEELEKFLKDIEIIEDNFSNLNNNFNCSKIDLAKIYTNHIKNILEAYFDLKDLFAEKILSEEESRYLISQMSVKIDIKDNKCVKSLKKWLGGIYKDTLDKCAYNFPYTLYFMMKTEPKFFHKIIREKPTLSKKRIIFEVDKQYFDELSNDPVYKEVNRELNMILAFKKNKMKFVDISNKTLINNSNLKVLKSLISDKLYNSFVDKLTVSESEQEIAEIKRILDNKITSICKKIIEKREKYLIFQKNKRKQKLNEFK